MIRAKKSRSLDKKELNIILKSKYGYLFQIMFECAIRYTELKQIKYSNIINNETIPIKTAKRGAFKNIKLSQNLIDKVRNINEKEFLRTQNFTNRYLNMVLKDICDWNNLKSEGISTHSFRKTLATIVYKKTKDPHYLQKWLGHSSLEATAHYIDTNFESLSVNNYIKDWYS